MSKSCGDSSLFFIRICYEGASPQLTQVRANVSALPGGNRNSDGSFNNAGNNGNWWTATENGWGDAYSRRMFYNYGFVGENSSDEGSGFSVRCVEDD